MSDNDDFLEKELDLEEWDLDSGDDEYDNEGALAEPRGDSSDELLSDYREDGVSKVIEDCPATKQVANGFFKELVLQLPKIASLLECPVGDLVSLNNSPGDYMTDPKLRDRPIKHIGILNGVPHISNYQKFHGTHPQMRYGTTLYETRKGAIRWVLYSTYRDDGGTDHSIFVSNKNLYRFRRYTLSQTKLSAAKNGKLPILEESFVEEILNSTIGFLQKKKQFQTYGVKIKRGVVFSGEPGNGKSMMCRYIRAKAAASSINYNSIDAANIEDAFAKNTLTRLLNQEGLLFIDDVDIAYFSRGGGKSDIACSLLSAMDGLDISGNTVRIFTTNENCKDMDKAFQRPGRIDKVFEFNKPTHELRERFIKSWHQEIKDYLIKGHHLDNFVSDTEGFSFAEVDLVKTNMVEYFIGCGEWDVNRALDMTKHRLQDIAREKDKGLGFAKKK